MTIEVVVRDNNVEKALRVLKKKLQKDGLFRELRLRQHFEKPSLKRQRKLKESLRRIAKEKRLKRLREGD
jgi:small subunit ribosomal protein S21